MESKQALDNMTGQEIKALFAAKQIGLEELEIPALEKLLDYETDLLFFDEGSMELIGDCCKRLEELRGNTLVSKCTTNEIIEANERTKLIIHTESKSGGKPVKLRVLVAAAILAATVACAFTASADLKFDAYGEASKLADKPVGTVVNFDAAETGYKPVTVQTVGVNCYSTVAELREKEGIDIPLLLPEKLPDGVEFLGLEFMFSGSAGGGISFLTDSPLVSVNISPYDRPAPESVTQKDYYTVCGEKFYLFPERGGYACAFTDGYCYSVNARNNNELMFILENMKEG